MIIRRLAEIDGTERDVEGGNWHSRRLMLAGEGLPYSMHDTVIRAGTTTEMWYRHHIESVYCIEGRGQLIDRTTGEEHVLEAGTLYVLDQHDKHTVIAETDLRMVCIFMPPVTGDEVHRPDGSYAPPPDATADDEPEGAPA